MLLHIAQQQVNLIENFIILLCIIIPLRLEIAMNPLVDTLIATWSFKGVTVSFTEVFLAILL